jgi:hypothetical protein
MRNGRKTRKLVRQRRSIDPVNDPAYNIVGIIKQSILLEEHISLQKKYCSDCITKHFLHIIGLAEEAILLAGSKLGSYPLLRESVDFYTDLFREWVAHRRNKQFRSGLGERLRVRRKELVHAYVLR